MGRRLAGWLIGGAASAVLFGACASGAAAAEIVRLRESAAADLLPIAQQTVEPALSGSPLSLAPAPRRTLQLDSKGRWGFRLDVDQPSARDQDLRDVQAGAYFRLSPRLRVGGSVGLGDRTGAPQNFKPQDPAPRVRLETNFKF